MTGAGQFSCSYCIKTPLSLVANDLSFLKRNDLLGNFLSWFRQREIKTQYLLAQCYCLKNSKRAGFCRGRIVDKILECNLSPFSLKYFPYRLEQHPNVGHVDRQRHTSCLFQTVAQTERFPLISVFFLLLPLLFTIKPYLPFCFTD